MLQNGWVDHRIWHTKLYFVNYYCLLIPEIYFFLLIVMISQLYSPESSRPNFRCNMFQWDVFTRCLESRRESMGHNIKVDTLVTLKQFLADVNLTVFPHTICNGTKCPETSRRKAKSYRHLSALGVMAWPKTGHAVAVLRFFLWQPLSFFFDYIWTLIWLYLVFFLNKSLMKFWFPTLTHGVCIYHIVIRNLELKPTHQSSIYLLICRKEGQTVSSQVDSRENG